MNENGDPLVSVLESLGAQADAIEAMVQDIRVLQANQENAILEIRKWLTDGVGRGLNQSDLSPARIADIQRRMIETTYAPRRGNSLNRGGAR